MLGATAAANLILSQDTDLRLADLITDTAVVLAPEDTVAAALARVGEADGRNVDYVAVCAEGRLVGLLRPAELIGSDASTALAALMTPAPVVATAASSAERTAWLAAHANAEVVAVEAADGSFIGLVPTSRFLPLLVREHEVDLARMGGFLRGAARARTASEERVLRRVLHRSPWLIIGLIGAVAAAQIVRAFEGELADRVALAFFLPGIVYMADAVGTQTETLVIRGLSVGVSIGRILRLEILTGAVVGLLLAAAAFPLALLVTGETELAAIVSVSLLASSSCASLVALCLPWLLDRLGLDPAFGSGPLATVIQDLLSIVIYFGVAVAFLG
jgi:magnesium transporter